MTIAVQIQDGTGSGREVLVDELNNLSVKEGITPKQITDVIDSSKTIVGEALEFDADEDAAIWRLKEISTDGIITKIRYADKGRYTQKWTERLTAFPEVTFANLYSMNFGPDAANRHIDLGDPAEHQFEYNNPFSISGWFKTTVSGEQVIFGKQLGSNNAGFRLSQQSNQIRMHLANSTSARAEVRSANVGAADGFWHHVVGTWDGNAGGAASGVTLYIDGVDITPGSPTTDTLGTNSILTSANSQIGIRNNTSNDFRGLLDEISIWNIELSLAQVQAIYGTGKPSSIESIEGLDAANNVGWWRMGDAGGIGLWPTIPDAGPNTSIHGTATNMEISSINVDVP